ncbi:MAG: sulfatase-like hydrolase/transferase [Crocinitomicaceae bacterium]|nr:sulfatase-like hydrolase/transferase [Crocinitomicaceae bacterium]
MIKKSLKILLPLGLVWLFSGVYRILLVTMNSKKFLEFGIQDYLIGAGFDLVTIALFFLPFITLLYLPLPERLERFRFWIKLLLFSFGTFLVFVFNGWDVAYFSYTAKRTSFDYFVYMLTNTETSSLAGDFIAEFWWLIVFFIFSLSLSIWCFVKIKSAPISWKLRKNWVVFVFIVTSFVIIGRGGFQLKPIGIIEATNYSSLSNAPAVLNSAFTIIKTIGIKGLEDKKYFEDAELNAIFNPIQSSQAQSYLPKGTNVCFILLESFGTMYSGPNSPESYTPFLDSLLTQSMFFEDAIANGRTSMDALPSVISSIPAYTNESFILSAYSANQFQGLPSILNKEGYYSAFFHGANNGSMRFDAFTSAAGFDSYYGRNEYPNDAHFDGNWGIEDHHMLSFAVDEMNRFEKPFFSMIFTLSSHHPYTIPTSFKSKVKHGPEPLCATISYVDFALKEFWEKAQKKAWFKNTLFVFCADHVGPTKRSDRCSLEWTYRIPIGFYHASMKLPKVKRGQVFQQIDIMPTIIDLLGLKTNYYSFGTSYFSPKSSPKMISEQGNLISFEKREKGFLNTVWNEQMKKQRNTHEKQIIREMKALYQHYTHDLITNQMTPSMIK